MEEQVRMIPRMERNSRNHKRKRNKYESKIMIYRKNEQNIGYENVMDDILYDASIASEVANLHGVRTRRTERNKKRFSIRRMVIENELLNRRESKSTTRKSSKIINAVAMSCMGMGTIYYGSDAYFKDHFLYGTTVNGIDLSFKTIPEANELINSEIMNYTLRLNGRENSYEEIKSSDIGLQYNLNGEYEVESIKNCQRSMIWMEPIFNMNKDEISYEAKLVSFDEDSLDKMINNLNLLNGENVIEPKDATLKFEDGQYVIVDEVYGNKINKDKLYDGIINALINGKQDVDLESIGCYEVPMYTSTSEKLIDAKNKMNEYAQSKIIYQIGKSNLVLDGTEIMNMLVLSDDADTTINQEKVNEYVDKLCDMYNTKGASRNFKTTTGNIITVSGGDYGFTIDREKEANQIIQDIQGKTTVEREPIYSQWANDRGFNDIGDTYVEISISNQHLWFYKSGILISHGDIVSGNVNKGTSTPGGIYSLKYTQRNTSLVGPGYNSPVSFWMPFNGGIGIHDASWRGSFGNNIYISNGSHGCINAPYYLARDIYNNIEAGTPIVCYY